MCQPQHQVFLITYLKFTKRMQGMRGKKKIRSVCNFIELKNNKLNYECKECKKIQLIPINELIKKFPNVYQFCNKDINKFLLLLRKAVYSYEYMDCLERLDKTSLPHKKAFYRELYLEHITDKDYTHTQKVFLRIKTKKSRLLS